MSANTVENSGHYFLEDKARALKRTLRSIIRDLGASTHVPLENAPKGMGDLAFPCFALAKELKGNPVGIAREIEERLREDDNDVTDTVFTLQRKGPYLNFTYRSVPLINNILSAVLSAVLSAGGDYGVRPEKDEFVILEHTSANPNGPFHVGRARNPIIGDTLARVLRKCGYDVEVQYWVNDMGRQAATLAWGKENIPESEIPPMERGDPFRDKDDHRLVRYYQEAHRRISEESGLESEIDDILYEIEGGNQRIKEFVRECSVKVLEGMKVSLSELNIHFDKFVWESASVEDGTVKEVIDTLKTSELAADEDGARYLELEDFGISGRNTRFYFTRSDGTSLYTTRDLAYHLTKLRRCDRAINVLGEDHKLQAKQLGIALKILGCGSLPENIFYSFVSMEEGKMSTRRGQVVFLDEMIREAVDLAYREVDKRRGDLSEKNKRRIADMVGRGCIRYNIIRVQNEKKIVFRWRDALNFEGDSSPFLQYAHARCSGILEKAAEEGWGLSGMDGLRNSLKLLNEGDVHVRERALCRVIGRFPEVVEEIGSSFRIHLLPAYLQELASALNNFYQSCPVVSEENKILRNMRLALVASTRTVLAEGLGLLGIRAPDSM